MLAQRALLAVQSTVLIQRLRYHEYVLSLCVAHFSIPQSEPPQGQSEQVVLWTGAWALVATTATLIAPDIRGMLWSFDDTNTMNRESAKQPLVSTNQDYILSTNFQLETE